MTLTPQERFWMTLSHKEPDRPPIDVSVVAEVGQALTDHLYARFGTKDILEALEVDFRRVEPAKTAILPGSPASTPVVQLPHGIYQDTHTRPLAWIHTLEDVEAYRPEPDPDQFDFSGVHSACLHARPYVTAFGGWGLVDIVNGLGARGRGYEQLLVEIMTQDPVVLALIDRQLEAHFEFCRRGLEAGRGEIDVLLIGEDCGIQSGPLFSPAMFRAFFAPRIKRFVDLAHAHGAACMMHCCGSVRQLLPIFIEKVGLDILQAVQPEAVGMDPEGLKRDFGDHITFCGMISLQKTLTRGTVEECRREAEHRVRVIGKGGGYIFSPANTITLDAPLENVLAIYEVVTGKALM